MTLIGLMLCLLVGSGATRSAAAAFTDPWVGDGPFGGGGQVQADPNHPGRLYLFAPGGPYQSDNHGSSWVTTTAIAGNRPFVYAPSDPTRAYRLGYCQLSASHDGGASWTVVSGSLAGPAGTKTPLAISPVNADTVYASIVIADTDHLAVSHDSGQTWAPIDAGITRVQDYGEGLLLSEVFIDPANAQHLIVSAGSGQWESGDDGASWHAYAPVTHIAAEPGRPTRWTGLEAGVPVLSADSGGTWTPIAIAVRAGSLLTAAAPAKAMYTLGADGPSDSGQVRVYRSTDEGLTWQPGASLPAAADPLFYLDPANPDRLFVVDHNGRLLRSLDGGDSWQPAVTGVPESNVSSVAPDPGGAGSALVAADGSLQSTADGGRHWVERPSPDGTSLQIVRAGGDASLLYDVSAGNEDASTWSLSRSRDGGASWELIRSVSPDQDCVVSVAPASTGIVYFTCLHAGLVRSTDGGTTWSQPVTLPFTISPSRTSMTIDLVDPTVIYAASFYQGLYKSIDGGTTWNRLIAPPLNPDSTVLSPTDPGLVYVVGRYTPTDSAFGSLSRSTDAGATWHSMATPGIVSALAVGPNGVLYASMTANFPGSYQYDTIMASPDGGATWTDIGGGAYAPTAAVSGVSSGRLWTIGYGVHSRPGLAWTGPRLAGPISVRLTRAGTLINGSVPVTLRWPAAKDEASPICSYRAEARVSNQSWTPVGRGATAATQRRTLARPGLATSYRVQAVACSGAESRWLTGPTIVPHVIQENAAAIKKQGTWRRVSDRRDSGGAQLVALGAGAAVSFNAANVTDIAFVATTGPAGGWPHVRIDLATATLVSLHSEIAHHRRLAYVHHLAAPGSVSLTIHSGGAANSRTTLDAIVTLRTLSAG